METPSLQHADPEGQADGRGKYPSGESSGSQNCYGFGEDIAGQIAEYAKLSNVSKVVLGRTNHKILFGQTKGTLADHVAQYAPKLDIYIIPDIETEGRKERVLRRIRQREERNRRLLWKGSEETA